MTGVNRYRPRIIVIDAYRWPIVRNKKMPNMYWFQPISGATRSGCTEKVIGLNLTCKYTKTAQKVVKTCKRVETKHTSLAYTYYGPDWYWSIHIGHRLTQSAEISHLSPISFHKYIYIYIYDPALKKPPPRSVAESANPRKSAQIRGNPPGRHQWLQYGFLWWFRVS